MDSPIDSHTSYPSGIISSLKFAELALGDTTKPRGCGTGANFAVRRQAMLINPNQVVLSRSQIAVRVLRIVGYAAYILGRKGRA